MPNLKNIFFQSLIRVYQNLKVILNCPSWQKFVNINTLKNDTIAVVCKVILSTRFHPSFMLFIYAPWDD